jgi:hypothetical protein
MELVSNAFEYLLNFTGSSGFIDVFLGIYHSKAEEFHIQLIQDGMEGISDCLFFESGNFDEANASVDVKFALEFLDVDFCLD